MVVETYVAGNDYRCLVIGGKLAAVAQRVPAGVDSASVSERDHDERVTALLGGGLLSERLRHGHESFAGDAAMSSATLRLNSLPAAAAASSTLHT